MSNWPEPPDEYLEIDDALERWAALNSLSWDRVYKDYSVRSHSFPLAGTESVQFWVDPPVGGMATVHVAFNSSMKSRRKSRKATYAFADLERGLEDALEIAREWRDVR